MSTMIKKYDDLKIGTRILFFKDMNPYTGMVIEKTSNIIKLMYVRGVDEIPGMPPYVLYYTYGNTRSPVEIDADSDWYPTGRYELPKSVNIPERRAIKAIMHSCAYPANINKIDIESFFRFFPKRCVAITPDDQFTEDKNFPMSSIVYKTYIRFENEWDRCVRLATLRRDINEILYQVRPVVVDGIHWTVYLKDLSKPNRFVFLKWLNPDYGKGLNEFDILPLIGENENIERIGDIDLVMDRRNETDFDKIFELDHTTVFNYHLDDTTFKEIWTPQNGFIDTSYLTRIF